ncbi:M3 family metallopeptidase [Peribacillus sp. SCS-155]|uniref:M3 family metallopeptidase n=1 Tax=Peribacillus sedimenti TaxID=3115297 RepID=UPI003905F37D
MFDTWDLVDKVTCDERMSDMDGFLEELSVEAEELLSKIPLLADSQNYGTNDIEELILMSQEVYVNWYQAMEVLVCFQSINHEAESLSRWFDKLNQAAAKYETCALKIDELLASLTGGQEEQLYSGRLEPIKDVLKLRLKAFAASGNAVVERAFKQVEDTGLHAWGDLYLKMVRKMKLSMPDGEDPVNIPIGQASSMVYYGEDRSKRLVLFDTWKKAWSEEAEIFAESINNIAAFRLRVYENRQEQTILQNSLFQNRMSEESLEVMWSTIKENRKPLLDYLKRKQQLWKADSLSWADQFAPLSIKNNSSQIVFPDAIHFISKQLKVFDQEIAEFVIQTAENRWIDAKISKDKPAGAFCASFPLWEQPRIMMSYSNDLQSAGVLAHELGHAYHYHLMYGLPIFLQDVPPSIAEISSTLFETIFMEGAIRHSGSVGEKIRLLDNQLIRDIGLLLNSFVRFSFEMKFYEKRKKGALSVQQLNDLMEAEQKDIFNDLFDTYEPAFWASLRHFYMTRKPFVHYPYTVAHLVSTGIYAQIKQQANRGDILREILTDSSRLTIEEIGKKHLQLDLQEPKFWQASVANLHGNVHEFLRLTADLV